jgi:hypothetical protein
LAVNGRDGGVSGMASKTPLPHRILVFMEIAIFCAQNREPIGVTGKILLIKDLGRIF